MEQVILSGDKQCVTNRKKQKEESLLKEPAAHKIKTVKGGAFSP